MKGEWGDRKRESLLSICVHGIWHAGADTGGGLRGLQPPPQP